MKKDKFLKSEFKRIYNMRKDLVNSLMSRFVRETTEEVKEANRLDCKIAFTFNGRFYLLGDYDEFHKRVLIHLMEMSIRELTCLRASDNSLYEELEINSYLSAR